MKDLMVDIETFGDGPDACIVQIGACYFDRNTGEIGDTFKVNIDAESSVKSGAKIDASTIYWWLQQSEGARASITEGKKIPVTNALVEFNDFAKGAKNVWSHATFDFVIITNALKRLDIIPSFHYRSAKDIRTLMDLSKGKVDLSQLTNTGTHHDALDDCKFQVKYCVKAMNSL